jgi:hypothetical protein
VSARYSRLFTLPAAFVPFVIFCVIGCLLSQLSCARAQPQPIVWSDQEKPVIEKIRTLRKLPEEQRAHTTKDLALQIRQLPAGMNKMRLANSLASLSTEGDLGHDTLQEVKRLPGEVHRTIGFQNSSLGRFE